MPTSNETRLILTTICFLSLITFACDSASQQSSSRDTSEVAAEKQASTESGVFPDDLFATEPISGARGVAEVKQDKAATGNIVITGRVGGRVEPFVNGAAVFILTDSSLKSCDQLHGDKCQQPWDYCCESRESLLANTATIRVTDSDGKPFALDIKDKHGLSPLATITIAGTISTHEENQLVIDAQRIFVDNDGKS